MLSNFKRAEADTRDATQPPPPDRARSSTVPQQSAPATSPAGGATSQGSSVRASDRSCPSVIGADLVIVGNLTSKGQVQIDGHVQGDIRGSHVVVGERASITGGIRAQEVVVRGQVMGAIHGRRVMLQAQSHVEGDVFHQTLAIEQGAFFEGKSRRSSDPLNEGAPAGPASAARLATTSAPSDAGNPPAVNEPVPFPPTGN